LPPRATTPAREHLQSELLVAGWLIFVLPMALLLLWVQTVIAWQNARMITSMEMHGIYLSLLLALLVLALRAATPTAALAGGAICFTMTMVTTQDTHRLLETALPSLFALVLLTLTATRLGHARKVRLGLAEAKRGRAVSQIIANLGMASAIALLHGIHTVVVPATIALLAEATADTLSSELGPLLGGRTLLLTTLQPVPAGTDGGISLGGTLCGIAGAAIVTTVGVTTMHLPLLMGQLAFFSALAGFFADSLLGATFERRGWLGNDLVNFLSTVVTTLVVLPLGLWLLP
jgi:uncharacterized protein (TIGR00297 family)